jgi:hypothetical protein
MKEAMKLALEALESCTPEDTSTSYVIHAWHDEELVNKAIKALEEALAKQEQGEPVAWVEHHKGGDNLNWEEVNHPYAKATPLYTTPQPKQDQGEPVAWEPIETAPKDGSMILICLPRQMNIVVRAWYNKIHNFWLTDYEGEGGITRPTYFHEGDLWHPIPPLYTTPQPKQEQGEPVAKNENGSIKWLIDDWPQNCLLYTHQPQSFTYEQVKAHIRAASMSANDISVGSDTTEDGVSIVIRRRDEILYAEFFAYTTPQQRTWVGMTDEEMHECAGEYPWTPTGLKCVRAIEAKLKEKNT